MRILTPLWRALRVTEHLFTGAFLGLLIRTGRALGYRPRWLPDLVSWWQARLCRALGLRIRVCGELAPSALLIANHVSWIDIPALGAQGRIVFLSKAEVREWPLIGWMSEIAGTLFIARGSNQAGKLAQDIAARIQSGGRVAVFPEGTTTDGTGLARFHPRLLAAGQQESVKIQPIALRYGSNAEPDPVAPFVGEDSLLPHLLRLLRHPGLSVHVRFLPPIEGAGVDRRHLAEQCRAAIAEALELVEPRQERGQATSEIDAQDFPPQTPSLGEAV